MTLDIPEEVRRKVVADGNAAWLDQLPSVVESLAQDWSLAIGASLRGGHAALVVEATLADGTAAVLKVGVPGTRRELGFEAAVLRLADGDGCASLLDSESALLPAPCGGRRARDVSPYRWCIIHHLMVRCQPAPRARQSWRGSEVGAPPVTSDSIRTMSVSMPRMSASISSSGRGGV